MERGPKLLASGPTVTGRSFSTWTALIAFILVFSLAANLIKDLIRESNE
jgi:hypothetical protein